MSYLHLHFVHEAPYEKCWLFNAFFQLREAQESQIVPNWSCTEGEQQLVILHFELLWCKNKILLSLLFCRCGVCINQWFSCIHTSVDFDWRTHLLSNTTSLINFYVTQMLTNERRCSMAWNETLYTIEYMYNHIHIH